MDETLRLASLTAFYFGSRGATTPPTTQEAITDISYRAYRDLCHTLIDAATIPIRKISSDPLMLPFPS